MELPDLLCQDGKGVEIKGLPSVLEEQFRLGAGRGVAIASGTSSEAQVRHEEKQSSTAWLCLGKQMSFFQVNNSAPCLGPERCVASFFLPC